MSEPCGEHHTLPSKPTTVARVSAANALLDRAYGKPAVKQEQEIVDLPPVVIQLTSLRSSQPKIAALIEGGHLHTHTHLE